LGPRFIRNEENRRYETEEDFLKTFTAETNTPHKEIPP
jgi:hypothetical protein